MMTSVPNIPSTTLINDNFEILNRDGMTILKLSSHGSPHEKVFKLSGDQLLLKWRSRYFSLKFGKQNQLYLGNVVRVEKGQANRIFNRFKPLYTPAETKSLSLIYYDDNGNEKSLNLICPTIDSYNYFMKAITNTITIIEKEKNEKSFDKRFITTLWRQADKDHNGSLDWSEICHVILPRLQIPITIEIIKMFEKVDRNNNNLLSYTEFLQFIQLIENHPELESLWYAQVHHEDISMIFHAPMKIIFNNINNINHNNNHNNPSTAAAAVAQERSESHVMISLTTFIRFWYV
jgi:hypothetical protein